MSQPGSVNEIRELQGIGTSIPVLVFDTGAALPDNRMCFGHCPFHQYESKCRIPMPHVD
jgi:hypothetical protein